MNRILIAVAAFALWSGAMFGAGWAWRGDRAETADARQDGKASAAVAQQQAQVRAVEHKQGQATQAAADSADTRREKIDADYEARLAAAVAGRDADIGRLRQQWEASAATARLSSDAGIAAAAAEADRLRLAGAARVLRATELAQAERDEAIERYEAARLAQAGVTP
ncbi:hypothetical protein [Pseudoxanthomonas winnipegensis]|uniref:Endopeptidase n=1 Tax=Pseudoxanthomonas winnipegensis TaxID=2480810 RepID=A0A4Q8L9T9_9GAMM|nr:hypothetical protein [Pseudoxanthomonas winnipegensis]RZZ81413.1 hypothetical protein EA663_20530 [Pseudoxanthomonas winnipegensis]TAA25408.1 hypothetical protein EA660_08070 [Pseudoxanthomonas winnipegensis]